MRLVSLAALLGAVFLLAGCGSSGGGISRGDDLANGRDLFINGDGDEGEQTCGSCHTLEAGGPAAVGTIGPNLDNAFRGSREQGFPEITFEQVVREQIAYPGVDSIMQPDLVTGEDAADVAYFVARCAANADDPVCAPAGGGAGDAETGEEVFVAAGCGSCHTLAAAGTSGTIGPNLDESRPSVDVAIDRVTNGRGAMPPFRDQLSEEQIRAVAEYVNEVAGG